MFSYRRCLCARRSNAFASIMVGSEEMAPSCVVDKAPTAFPRHNAFSITSLFHVRSPSSKPASIPATKPSPAPVVSTGRTANPGMNPRASAVKYVQPALPCVTTKSRRRSCHSVRAARSRVFSSLRKVSSSSLTLIISACCQPSRMPALAASGEGHNERRRFGSY